jgi:hypothetical protein
MDPSSFDTQLETSPLLNEIARQFIQFENSLDEIKQSLDEVNRKIDLLLHRSPVYHASEYRGTVAARNVGTWNGSGPYPAPTLHQYPSHPIAHNQILVQNGQAGDDEFWRLGTS